MNPPSFNAPASDTDAEAKASPTAVPFVCVLDEMGYYADPSLTALFNAARSGSFASIFAEEARKKAQDSADAEAGEIERHLNGLSESVPAKRL